MARFGRSLAIHSRVSRTEKWLGWRRVAQCIDDPQIEAFEKLLAFRRDRVEVRRIGNIAEAEAQCVDLAMFEPERQGLDRRRPAPRSTQISPGVRRCSVSSGG